MNSFQILEQFVEENNLKKSSIKLVKPEINKFYDIYGDKDDLIYESDVITSILADLFKLNSNNLKLISDELVSLNLNIGRRHKKIVLSYLNYRNEKNLNSFFDEIVKDNNNIDSGTKNYITSFINDLDTNFEVEAYKNFSNLWGIAEKEKDKQKLKEYLIGIFLRIYMYYNNDQMSLCELLEYNKPFIKDDLSEQSIKKLETFCKENNDCEDSIHEFYEEYIKLLKSDLQQSSLNGELEEVMNQKVCDNKLLEEELIKDRGNDLSLIPTEEFNAVYFSLNQEVFDKFESLYDFYDYVLNYIKQIYRVLENNKVFGIEIEDIYFEGRNIKWDLYAYLGVFSERFIKTKEEKLFFKPEELCFDMFSFYSITLKERNDVKTLKKTLRGFYKNKKRAKDVYKLVNTDMDLNKFEEFISQWQFVFYGFSFNDCFILKNENKESLNDLNMKNEYHILMIFYKYRIDNRKIPCPVCGGLNVSGNSFPEIGHRSWECKNIICSKRSKSNRGKRYSFKTNYMQYNAANPTENNIISKDLISKWRRDVVDLTSKDEIYEMFVKYFSFENETILFLNSDLNAVEISKNHNRNSCLLSLVLDEGFESNIEEVILEKNSFKNYFEDGEYVKRFLVDKEFSIDDDYKNKVDSFMTGFSEGGLIHGDSFVVLNTIEEKTISSAVTSPPYYNAREYSQWSNLYLYLIDMYNIIKASKKALKDSGIFLYNIGDINGNENTIVKSNMGTKRLLLGSYSILLFKACGYELVDNIIWDKGEPQSKRSTNDGNFTPHYQKPVNAYEHMFIFKKESEDITINNASETWVENAVYFSPVIKINLKGENTLGHTAPFPLDIPDFVAKKFNKSSDDILLDPFSGSGTTIRSALDNKIKGLGIELSEEYVNLSKDIIEKEEKDIEILY